MRVSLRIDDFPYGTPEDRRKYNPEEAYAKLTLLESAGIEYMLSVSPDLLSGEDWKFLQTLKRCVICQHGFDHGLSHWRPVDEEGGEFSGMTEAMIIQEFKEHVRLYELFYPYIFVPPFNSFTQELLDVLRLTPIEIVTGGPETLRCGFEQLDFHGRQLRLADKFYCSIPDILAKLPTITADETIAFHLPWESKEHIQELLTSFQSHSLTVKAYERITQPTGALFDDNR